MTENEYRLLLDDSYEYVNSRADFFESEFSLSSFDARRFDLGQGRLFLLKGGKAGVEGEVQIVGSISAEVRTWLWSWADPRFSLEAAEDIQKLRTFGEKNDIEKLIKDRWPATESDGWDMSAIAANLIKADGTFRKPEGTGALFLIFKKLRWIGLS